MQPQYEASTPSPEEDRQNVLTLRYGDDESSMDTLLAADLATVLDGLRELTEVFAKSGGFDDETVIAPELRVYPPKQGSFLLDVVMEYSQDYLSRNSDELTNMGVGGASGMFLLYYQARVKAAKTLATAQTKNDDGNYTITFSDGSTLDVSPTVQKAFNAAPKKSKRALRKLLTPLSDDADYLEVTAPTSPEPPVRAEKATYEALLPEDDEQDNEPASYTLDITTPITMADFKQPVQWRVKIPNVGFRKAYLLDTSFKKRVGPDDEFKLRVQVDPVQSGNGYKDKYSIIEVLEHIPGDTDDNPSSPAPQD